MSKTIKVNIEPWVPGRVPLILSTHYKYDIDTVLKFLKKKIGTGTLYDMARGGCAVLPDARQQLAAGEYNYVLRTAYFSWWYPPGPMYVQPVFMQPVYVQTLYTQPMFMKHGINELHNPSKDQFLKEAQPIEEDTSSEDDKSIEDDQSIEEDKSVEQEQSIEEEPSFGNLPGLEGYETDNYGHLTYTLACSILEAHHVVAARLEHYLVKKATMGDSSEERLNNLNKALKVAHRIVKHLPCKEPQYHRSAQA